MKNISLILAPYSPYTPAPMPPSLPSPATLSKPAYSVSLSVQFEDEAESLAYAKFILEAVHTFKDGDR